MQRNFGFPLTFISSRHHLPSSPATHWILLQAFSEIKFSSIQFFQTLYSSHFRFSCSLLSSFLQLVNLWFRVLNWLQATQSLYQCFLSVCHQLLLSQFLPSLFLSSFFAPQFSTTFFSIPNQSTSLPFIPLPNQTMDLLYQIPLFCKLMQTATCKNHN